MRASPDANRTGRLPGNAYLPQLRQGFRWIDFSHPAAGAPVTIQVVNNSPDPTGIRDGCPSVSQLATYAQISATWLLTRPGWAG
jgi:hypothetical protein